MASKTYLPSPLTPKAIQELLCINGIGLSITDALDAATKRAVKEFQEMKGLEVDGVVGPITTRVLSMPILTCAELVSVKPLIQPDFASCLCWVAEQHLNLHPTEIGGDNKGPWVRLFSDGVDGASNYWCAWWSTYCVQQAWDIATALGWTPTFTRAKFRSSWCPGIQTAATKENRLITPAEALADPVKVVRPGQLFLVWSASKNRVAHVGIVVGGGQADGTFETIEGNTNDDGSPNGTEVARRIRMVDTCYYVDLTR